MAMNEIKTAPDWLLKALDAKRSAKGLVTAPTTNVIHEGGRNTTLTRLGGRLRRSGLSQPELFAALDAVNQERCDPPLPEIEVQTIATSLSCYETRHEPSANGKPVNEAADDPHKLARLFLQARCTHKDGPTLKFWREQFWRWDDGSYHVVPDKELRAHVTRTVKNEMNRINQEALGAEQEKPPMARRVTGRLISDVLHALAGETILPSGTEPPAWLQAPAPFPADEVLACRNTLLYLPTLTQKEPVTSAPSPKFFSPNCLPFNFDSKAPSPKAWLSFLSELWPDDPESVGTLQEWLGYLLTSDSRQQKILMIVGPRRSGKGTIARVFRGLVGADNTCCPTLSSLGTNFGLWPLVGKTIALIQDARLSGRSDTAMVAERLLSISGEDGQTIDRKNLPHITTKLRTRFVLLTNELPRLTDVSGALPGRMILLRLTQSWYRREDVNLTNKLLVELPSILLWALAGWRRLRQRGHFVQPEASKALADELDDLSSPIGAFVRERCRLGVECQVERSRLYTAWKQWSAEQGRDYVGDAASFGRNLHAAVPSLESSQPRTESGERTRFYEGIGLK
jgi:putative DNA primase/helicase